MVPSTAAATSNGTKIPATNNDTVAIGKQRMVPNLIIIICNAVGTQVKVPATATSISNIAAVFTEAIVPTTIVGTKVMPQPSAIYYYNYTAELMEPTIAGIQQIELAPASVTTQVAQ